MQVAQQKKQLAVSFADHIIQNYENTICVKFQFYNSKLSQKRCFMLCVCSSGLCKGCYTKEAIDSFFRRAISINSWNKDVLNFRFMVLNLANRNVLYMVSSTQGYTRLIQLMAYLVEHPEESHENSISTTF